MRVRPRVLDVVDDERDVGRDEVGLDRAEVDARDVRLGVVVGEVDGPRARAAADVEDVVELLGEGRELQAAVEGQGEEVVLQVEAVFFAFVVGEEVGAVLVGVVGAPVFFAVAQDAGFERGGVALAALGGSE